MLQTLGTTAGLLCELLLLLILLLVEEESGGGGVRLRRGVLAGADGAEAAAEAGAEADTGVVAEAAGDIEIEAGDGHETVTGIKGTLWNGRLAGASFKDVREVTAGETAAVTIATVGGESWLVAKVERVTGRMTGDGTGTGTGAPARRCVAGSGGSGAELEAGADVGAAAGF